MYNGDKVVFFIKKLKEIMNCVIFGVYNEWRINFMVNYIVKIILIDD